jgi:DNA polymerase/3'-5' exonuclease PolX
MSTGVKIPYVTAMNSAETLLAALEPDCVRTLIAGSLRRRKAEVSDIELVVISKTRPAQDLFGPTGHEESMLDDALSDLGITSFRKNGPKFKQFEWQGVPIDLFIATVDTWGCVATIRTGSADFSHWLVTSRRQGGACPAMYRFDEGRIYQGPTPIATPEERDVFELLELPWIEPVARLSGRWRR